MYLFCSYVLELSFIVLNFVIIVHAATSSTTNVFNLLLAIVFNIYYSDGTVKLWRIKSRLDSMA